MKNTYNNFIKQYINNLAPENEYQEYALKKLKEKKYKTDIFYEQKKINKNNINSIKINEKIINNKIIFNNGIYESHSLQNNINVNIINIDKNIPEEIKNFYNFHYINKLNNLDLINYIAIKKIMHLQINEYKLKMEPIFIIYNNEEKKNSINNTKNFINIKKNITIQLIEIYTNDTLSFNNFNTHIKINNNSKIKHYILNYNNNTINKLKYTININNNVKYSQKYISFNGNISQNNLKTIISGNNSNIKIRTLSKPYKNKTNITYCTIHKKPYNKSNCLIKNIASKKSNTNFEGIIKIEEKAFKTIANLHAQCIMLSNDSTINHKPKLSIKNKNVICNHSSTIGTFNEKILLYMKARGLKKKEILEILIESFIYPITKNTTKIINNIK